MAEYIDRESLLDKLWDDERAAEEDDPFDDISISHERAAEIIENEPAADVAPVVHAHFEPHGVEGTRTRYWTCSKCKQGYNTIIPVLYCLRCGAKMDEEASASERKKV